MTNIPTQEQQQCVNLFERGSDIVINAFAGAGKTTTLVMLANSSSSEKRGLYVAYNKSIVKEAKRKFPKNVYCSTIDSLAVGNLREFDLQAKVYESGNLNLKKSHIKRYFGSLENYYYYYAYNSYGEYEPVCLSEDNIFELILKTIYNFFRSDAKSLLPKHVPVIDSMKGLECQESTCHLKIYIAKLAIKYVDDAFCIQTSTPFGFEGAVKLWALSNPILPYDFVLLDEAQDTNPVFADVLKMQNCQKIIVGDKYQQIYSWRGAINAMDKFDIKNIVYLTRSFRFGAAIAGLASTILYLLKESHKVIGSGPEWVDFYNKLPEAYLCNTNAGVTEVILELLNNGITPIVPENIKTFFGKIKELEKILNGVKSNDPLFIGISNFKQLQECALEDPGSEYAIYVRLLNKIPIQNIIASLSKFKQTKNGPVVTTIHKSKGKEWDFVKIHDDFPSLRQNNGFFCLPSDLLNLIYVAITRGRKSLIIPNIIKDCFEIVHQKRKYYLQLPSNTITCQGYCPRCKLVNMEIAYSFDELYQE